MSKIDKSRNHITLRTNDKESRLLNLFLEDSNHKDRSKAIRSVLFAHIRDYYTLRQDKLHEQT
jgi:hypothetical protein